MELTTQDKVDLLWKLFVHREDTYAEQWYDKERGGGYNRRKNGWCNHKPPCRVQGKDCPDVTYVPLDREAIIAHLQGRVTIGTYAIDTNDTVKWLCLDMDIRKGEVGDVQALTMDVGKFVASILPRNCFRVEDSGNRGYHLWIFFAEPVPAALAYALGSWIRVKVPTESGLGIEVYPKQTMITRVGNPVKIPLGEHRKTGRRCLFVRGNFEPWEVQWDALTSIEPLTRTQLDQVIQDHDIHIVELMEPSADSNTKSSFPCMTRLMEEGIEEGSRDIGFFRLALYLKDRGLPADATRSVMETVNMKCNPPFEAVEDKLVSAYSGQYSVFPCYDPAFDTYCSSSCRFFMKKKKDRGNGDPRIIAQLSRD